MITITDLDTEEKYNARDLSEFRSSDIDAAKTAIKAGTSIGVGRTVVENKPHFVFWFNPAEGRNFLLAKARDFTFGSYFKDESGWVSNSYYFHPNHGESDKTKNKSEVFEDEQSAKEWLIRQYEINAWQI